MKTFRQLSLAIALDDQATFDNFYAPNGTPQHMATFLLKDEGRKFAYLSGASGTGLSHLLQAICQSTALGRNSGALYLPLEELSQYPPEQVLEGLENAPLVCIDDLQLVSDREDWHIPLFNLFNNCRDAGCRLSDEVALFLLNRLPRDTHALMEALEILDKASLREQRRLTTPFVKEALGL